MSAQVTTSSPSLEARARYDDECWDQPISPYLPIDAIMGVGRVMCSVRMHIIYQAMPVSRSVIIAHSIINLYTHFRVYTNYLSIQVFTPDQTSDSDA